MQHVSNIFSTRERGSGNPWEYDKKRCCFSIETPLKQWKIRKNMGLHFRGCGNFPNRQCKFFEWKPEIKDDATSTTCNKYYSYERGLYGEDCAQDSRNAKTSRKIYDQNAEYHSSLVLLFHCIK